MFIRLEEGQAWLFQNIALPRRLSLRCVLIVESIGAAWTMEKNEMQSNKMYHLCINPTSCAGAATQLFSTLACNFSFSVHIAAIILCFSTHPVYLILAAVNKTVQSVIADPRHFVRRCAFDVASHSDLPQWASLLNSLLFRLVAFTNKGGGHRFVSSIPVWIRH